MYCKKCGFKMDESSKECPFCHNKAEEKTPYKFKLNKKSTGDDTLTPIYEKTEVIKVKEVNQEDVRKQEYVNINEEEQMSDIRNHLGYVNLKTQFWHHILIAGVGYLLMNIIFMLVGSAILKSYVANGMDFSCISDSGDMSSCPIEVVNAYTKLSCIAQVVGELSVVIITTIIFFKYLKPFFKEFKEKRTAKWFGIGFLMMYGLSMIYSIILTTLDLASTSTNQDAVNETIFANPLLGFLFVVIAAPLFEEIIFRFGIFRAFTGKNKKLEIAGIVITTILFASVHMVATFETVFVDPANPNWEVFKSDMLSLPSYLIGAFCLTFAYYKSKNLLTPILMHMAWNFMAFIGIVGSSILDFGNSSEAIINFIPTLIETLTRLF